LKYMNFRGKIRKKSKLIFGVKIQINIIFEKFEFSR